MRAPGSEMKRLGHGIRSILTLHKIRPEYGVRGVTRSHGARMEEEHVRAASSPSHPDSEGGGRRRRNGLTRSRDSDMLTATTLRSAGSGPAAGQSPRYGWGAPDMVSELAARRLQGRE